MRLISVILIFIALFANCKNTTSIEPENVDCLMQMKEIFKNDLKCTEKGVMEVNLYSGMYEGKITYFTNTMCPTCNTVAPEFGYTCDGTKITIVDFNKNVTKQKEMYNSCTLQIRD